MRQNISYFVYNRWLDTIIFCPFEFEFWRIAAMHNTKDITVFYPLKEINTEIKQLLIPVGEYHAHDFSKSTFSVDSAFSPITWCAFAGFYHQLKCKMFFSYLFGCYF